MAVFLRRKMGTRKNGQETTPKSHLGGGFKHFSFLNFASGVRLRCDYSAQLESWKHFLFSPLPGEMIQSDKYFSTGLKPPTSHESYEAIQAVTFLSPCWRSINLSKRSRFHRPKKVTKNCQVHLFSFIYTPIWNKTR